MKVLAILILLAGPSWAQDGAALFQGGGGLVARLGGADGPILPQGQFSCAGCHGPDGRGGSEGGNQPAPPIDWTSLATATPERPAYDETSFARLLAQGVTPSGRVISARMPRFQAPPQDVAALAAHLRSLDARERQGLGGDSIAVALPGDPGPRDAALAAIAVFNAQGGTFGRQIVVADPAFLDLGAALETLLPRLRQAEETRVRDLLAGDAGLRPFVETAPARRIAATLDRIGPHLSALASRGTEVQAVGPLSDAVAWAVDSGHDARAAHAFAATRAALELLRDMGRQPTRSGFGEMLETRNLDSMIQVYRPSGD